MIATGAEVAAAENGEFDAGVEGVMTDAEMTDTEVAQVEAEADVHCVTDAANEFGGVAIGDAAASEIEPVVVDIRYTIPGFLDESENEIMNVPEDEDEI